MGNEQRVEALPDDERQKRILDAFVEWLADKTGKRYDQLLLELNKSKNDRTFGFHLPHANTSELEYTAESTFGITGYTFDFDKKNLRIAIDYLDDVVSILRHKSNAILSLEAPHDELTAQVKKAEQNIVYALCDAMKTDIAGLITALDENHNEQNFSSFLKIPPLATREPLRKAIAKYLAVKPSTEQREGAKHMVIDDAHVMQINKTAYLDLTDIASHMMSDPELNRFSDQIVTLKKLLGGDAKTNPAKDAFFYNLSSINTISETKTETSSLNMSVSTSNLNPEDKHTVENDREILFAKPILTPFGKEIEGKIIAVNEAIKKAEDKVNRLHYRPLLALEDKMETLRVALECEREDCSKQIEIFRTRQIQYVHEWPKADAILEWLDKTIAALDTKIVQKEIDFRRAMSTASSR